MNSLVVMLETSITLIAILDESNLPLFQNSGGGVFTRLSKPVAPPLYGSYWEEVK